MGSKMESTALKWIGSKMEKCDHDEYKLPAQWQFPTTSCGFQNACDARPSVQWNSQLWSHLALVVLFLFLHQRERSNSEKMQFLHATQSTLKRPQVGTLLLLWLNQDSSALLHTFFNDECYTSLLIAQFLSLVSAFWLALLLRWDGDA